LFNDVLGDTIQNAVTAIVKEKTKTRDNAQLKYDGLVTAHKGDLENRDLRKYRKESGLKNAEKSLAFWQGVESNINDMIETFETTMPSAFQYINSRPTNVQIGYSPSVGPSGANN